MGLSTGFIMAPLVYSHMDCFFGADKLVILYEVHVSLNRTVWDQFSLLLAHVHLIYLYPLWVSYISAHIGSSFGAYDTETIWEP